VKYESTGEHMTVTDVKYYVVRPNGDVAVRGYVGAAFLWQPMQRTKSGGLPDYVLTWDQRQGASQFAQMQGATVKEEPPQVTV
jgi:hypothetical protein